ncbi:MAG: Adhesin AidA-related [Bacteroidetes bacterium]|nr:MAG: Adhesin AidA-related [Bacteroidota bacterium]
MSASGGSPGYTYNWAPSGGASSTASGLTAGGYTVTITDINGCTATSTVSITQPTALTATTSQVNVTCFAATTGSATVNASGGTPAYTYLWNPSGQTTSTASGLASGSYTCTITDANGCTTTATFNITQPTQLTASASAVNTNCGQANGQVSVTASGGTTAYSYLWAPGGQTTSSVTGLLAGTYTVTVTDANGCTVTATATVSNLTGGTASISASTNVLCFGGTNGSATVTMSGGTGPFTYGWSPSGGTGTTANNLTAGTYTVTVTDAVGCTITQPAALTSTITGSTPVSCNGGNNGTATVSASGGSPGYNYNWTPSGGAAATATGLISGNYTVTITDINGCTTTSTVGITQPTAVSLVSSQVNVVCSGGSTGSATINAGGGTGPYTYSWNPGGQTTATATNLNAGTYTCTVTDANGCTNTATFNITQPALLSTTTSSVSSNCGQANGQVSVTASGGILPYSYLWAPGGQTTATVINLMAGNYTVTVTDGNGCTTSNTANISNISGGNVSITASTPVTCNGGSNGSATATMVGGTLPYTYAWTPSGGTAATATNLTAGTYTITVTDGVGCATTATVTITEPTLLTSSITASTPVSCNAGNNGSATVTASGGTPGYTYTWTPAGGSSTTATGLTAGSYTVTISDINNCTTTSTVSITQPTALSATTSLTNVNCFGGNNGTAGVTVTGGVSPYTYSWNPGGQTTQNATGLTAGSYTVTATDANGCTITASVTLTQPTQLTATVTAVNTTCGQPNGQVSVAAGGGTPAYTYLWSPGGATTATVTGLSAGAYNVIVTDGNGCQVNGSGVINNISGGTASIASVTNVSCNGGSNGSATVSMSGGTLPYTYSWAPSGGSAPTANALAAGTYTCTITDASACSTTITVTITEPAVLASSITSSTNITCNAGSNGAITVSVTGGTGPYSYNWTPSGGTGSTASGLTAGSYTCTITDANGCVTATNTSLTQPLVLSTVTSSTNATCTASNGSASVVVSGGVGPYTYSWNPSGQTTSTASNIPTGSYTVNVTDANGCATTATVNVGQNTGGTAVISSSINVSCFGVGNGSATVSISGNPPYTYNWQPGNQSTSTATNLVPGTYTVNVTDTYGCTSSATTTITEPTAITYTSTQVNVNCNNASNGSATVNPSGGTGAYAYLWSPSNQTTPTATGLGIGTYSCVITDINGCSITATVNITQPGGIVLTETHVDANCNQSNGSGVVTAQGGTQPYTYLWNPGGQTTPGVNGLAAGTYIVTVTDANGCSQTIGVTIANLAGPVASIASQVDVLCNGGNNGNATISVNGGTAPYTYVWSNAQTTGTATNLTAGTYTVSATDVNGCVASTSVTITEPNALAGNLISTDPSCFGQSNGTASISVNGGTTPYTYSWSPGGQTTPAVSGLSAGQYIVTTTDANGCVMSQTVTLTNPPVMIANTTVTNVGCYNACNGTATATVINGTGPYTYLWNDPSTQTTMTAGNLCAGSYSVTVTDFNGCTAMAGATITQPAIFAASISQSSNVSCAGACDGSATATTTGGTAPYSFMWLPGNQSSASVNNMCAGTYTVNVTDANGCSATTTVTITEPIAITTSILGTNASCNGTCDGTATVVYNGGVGPYSFLWNPAFQTTPNVTNLCAGTYSVTITDANGCTSTNQIAITEPTILGVNITTTSPSNCGQANGSACAQIIGGVGPYTYSWNDPAQQTTSCANNIQGNSYTVTVTDANGCSAIGVANVNDIAAPVVNINPVTDVTCFGANNGTAQANISGGAQPYNLLWSNGQTSAFATNLGSGPQTITVTDAAGCVASASVNIFEPTQLLSAIISTSDASCFGSCNGIATVGAGGGTTPYTYSWNDPGAQTSQTATALCQGSYIVTITDANGCTATSTATITQPTQVTATLVSQTDASCNGGSNGSVSVNTSGGTPGYTYSWTPNVSGGPQAFNLAAGTYALQIIDANGCTFNSSYNITEPTPVTAIPAVTDASCGSNNGKINLAVSGGTPGYTFQWNDPQAQTTQLAANLFAGTYTCIITDANGCTGSVSATVIDMGSPAIDSTFFSAPLCNGTLTGSATVIVKDGTPPYSYYWTPTNQTSNTANGLGVGTYTCTITDANGCTVTAVINVTQPAPLIVLVSPPDTVCYGQVTQVWAAGQGGTPGYQYFWDNGNTTPGPFTVNSTTNVTYSVFVVDTNGCQSPTMPVTVVVLPALTVTSPTVTICNGQTATLTATGGGGNGGPYTYTWSNGFTGSTQTVTVNTSQSPAVFIVTIDDGCSDAVSDTTVVIVNPTAVAFFSATDTAGCAPLTTYFQAFSDIGTQYIWDFGDSTGTAGGTTPSYTYNNAGVYDVTLIVVTAQGCSTVVVQPGLVEVYPVPVAAFTPTPNEATLVNSTISFIDGSSGNNTWEWDFGAPGSADTSNLADPQYTYTDTGTYTITLTVTNSYGCTSTVSDEVIIRPDYILFAPNCFTPNGDGKNEYFFPVGVGIDNNNFVMYIFDRWGNLIFETHDINRGWDGHANGGKYMAQEDVYVWKIVCNDFAGNEHMYLGHVTLLGKNKKR